MCSCFTCPLGIYHQIPARWALRPRHRGLAAYFCQGPATILRRNSSNAMAKTIMVTCSSLIRRKFASSKLVNSLKGVSSRRLRAFRSEITGRYRKGCWGHLPILQPPGVGAPLDIIRKYVEYQCAKQKPR